MKRSAGTPPMASATPTHTSLSKPDTESARLLQLIAQAVEAAVSRADHPVGVCLSGGIDSSTIASLTPSWVPLFTGYYQGAMFDERPFAVLLTEGREWHEVEIIPDDFVRVFDAVADALNDEELRCGPGAIGQYMVAEHAVHITPRIVTLLTGEGGDELFGGYARQHLAAGIEPPDGYENYELPDDYPTTLHEALEVEWDALRTLTRVDETIAGCHGITVTPPLLDPWVVAHVHQLPTSRRIGKRLLKDAMRGVVPDRILDRTDKRGFPAPFVQWAQTEPVLSFVHDRIGYTPNPDEPWSRQWWYDMLDSQLEEAAA